MDYEGEQFQEALRNWINGNYSHLNRAELIALAQYFDRKSKALKKVV